MSTTTQAVENGTDSACDHRPLPHDRFVRGCTQDMTVSVVAPHLVEVTHDDETYTVDLHSGACECPDQQYRGVYCKHSVKAALVAIYTDGVTTTFVARVAHHATAHDCPADNDGQCDGPTGPRFPCPVCVAATTVGEWEVWLQTEGYGGHR